MSGITFNIPVSPVSFGQVSCNLLRETQKREMRPLLFPIGGRIDLSCYPKDNVFEKYLVDLQKEALKTHSRDNKTLKLWHLNGALDSPSKNHLLYTFYELDSPTECEKNVFNNLKVAVSSLYTKEIFEKAGCECHYVPLGFDDTTFHATDKQYFDDDRITFNLCGKFEHRKHHSKILKAWVQEFGGNTKYHLQCALYNPFLDQQQNNQVLSQSLEGKRYPNVSFLNHMKENTLYNDFLNSSDIIIGMSGGEGWGLPEFQSVCLGKHSVILNAHGYKGWADEHNSVLVDASEKVSSVDNMFFEQGAPFNQGYIFNWEDQDFIEGCHKAIKRVESDKINEAGLQLGKELTYSKTLDGLLELLP